MQTSVIAPVKNEFPWLGFSIMAAEPFVDEFIYTVAASSDDGTIELLEHLKGKLKSRLKFFVSEKYDFKPSDTAAYNESFNDCLKVMSGDAAFFLHPDMVVTRWGDLKEGPLAWYTHVTSYAGDMTTQIVKGRAAKWKNIHANKFGLHYAGAYGSQNEDFYHRDITGTTYKHHDQDFDKYPFEVADSGIRINHYCEVKSYRRRLEKMKLCLKAQHPGYNDDYIEELASHHPRVTLESTDKRFGDFEFKASQDPIPDVFYKFKKEFEELRTSNV